MSAKSLRSFGRIRSCLIGLPLAAKSYRSGGRECADGRAMSDFLLMIGFVAVWVTLQVWILPKLGVST